VTIRHRTDVTALMRLRWRGRILQILSLASAPRREWLFIRAGETLG
jgi:head-tail adaptor